MSQKHKQTMAKVLAMISSARKQRSEFAEAHLVHWLKGTGQDIRYPASRFRHDQATRDGLAKVMEQFKSAIKDGLQSGDIKPGISTRRWESSFEYDKLFAHDQWYGFGGMHVSLEAEIEVRAVTNGYQVEFVSLKVSLSDRYDWDAGKGAYVVPNGEWVADEEMKALNAPNGPAKEFDIWVEPWYEDHTGFAAPFMIDPHCILFCW